jgi:hypothetical protein
MKLFADVFVNEHTCRIASFLGPLEWPALRHVSRVTTQELRPKILQLALVEMLTHTIAQLSLITTPTKGDFERLQESFQVLISTEAALREVASSMVAAIVDIVFGWFRFGAYKLKSVGDDYQQLQKQSRLWFRGMDHKLWTAAVHKHPQHYAKLCRIIATWPVSFSDRDLLLKSGAAALPSIADSADALSVVGGLQLGVKLSCGSEKRVALVERESLSTKAAEAMRRFENNENVIVHALAYLNNVAQCQEQWPVLTTLGLEPLCWRAVDLFKNHPSVQDYGHNILEVLADLEALGANRGVE